MVEVGQKLAYVKMVLRGFMAFMDGWLIRMKGVRRYFDERNSRTLLVDCGINCRIGLNTTFGAYLLGFFAAAFYFCHKKSLSLQTISPPSLGDIGRGVK